MAIESDLNLPLPDNFEIYDVQVQEQMVDYLRQLNLIERTAYCIGKSHLGSSFNVVKSNGFNEWKKKRVAAENSGNS